MHEIILPQDSTSPCSIVQNGGDSKSNTHNKASIGAGFAVCMTILPRDSTSLHLLITLETTSRAIYDRR
ncbi:hypothetical protein B0H34DRAFT_722536 [Crassisporium funariophilum]|nr:hypothetical protein B0H34DRAFT_722536 [Crassisporium funariophilum]